MTPSDKVIELKSLKMYLYQFRTKLFSYERITNVIYDDLLKIYEPKTLLLQMEFNLRGGISSKLTVDSKNR